jgi:uncharacterized protein involved in exopolysaccharide biosynthesis
MEEKNMKHFADEDFTTLLVKLWNKRLFLIKWGLIGAVVGVLIGFSIPKTYTSKVIIAPELEQQMGSSLGAIASMVGASLDNSIDAITFDMLSNVLSSTPFLMPILEAEVESKDGSIKTTLLDYMQSYQKKPWWSHVLGAPFKLLSKLKNDSDDIDSDKEFDMMDLPYSVRVVIQQMPKTFNISKDSKNGLITLSVTMQDPKIAATVLTNMLDNLIEFMSDYRTQKDRQDIRNLEVIYESRKNEYYQVQEAYADFLDSNKSIVRQRAKADQLKMQQEMQLAYQVYSQVATQLEAARIKEQQSKPVLVVLEPISIPAKKSAPSKAKLLIAFGFLAFCGAGAWVLFGKDYFERVKNLL